MSARPETEARRCARCGQPELVCTNDWRLRVAGVDTPGRVLDFRCRSCGAEVTLVPRKEIAIDRLFAWLFLPAIFPSVIFFARARRKERAYADNPIVPGRYAGPPEPPRRLCTCGRAARCVASRTNVRRTGTRRAYRCEGCGRAFVVHDARGILQLGLGACVLAAAGVLVMLAPPGGAVGAQASNRWFGVMLAAAGLVGWVVTGAWVRGRVVHPEDG